MPKPTYTYVQTASPQEMDLLLADGWRHFGTFFFRTPTAYQAEELVQVIPLRINLSLYVPSKRYRKLARKCQEAGLQINYQPVVIDKIKRQMFDLHKQRFKENPPNMIEDFLHHKNPDKVPCPAIECNVYNLQNQLVATSFVDVTQEALSSIYAMFLPTYEHFSLGIYTILGEINYAQIHQKKYLYLGYAYNVPSFYDYKKRFLGLEYYDWQGNWLPYS